MLNWPLLVKPANLNNAVLLLIYGDKTDKIKSLKLKIIAILIFAESIQ